VIDAWQIDRPAAAAGERNQFIGRELSTDRCIEGNARAWTQMQ
jgi:hypothetical protein